MNNDAYTLLIIFIDRPQQVIHNVENYGFSKDAGTFYFIRNGIRCFVPKENVIYFGSFEQWRSE